MNVNQHANQRLLLTVLKNMSIILFVVIFIVFSLFNRRFSTLNNFENIILSAADVGIIAIGMVVLLVSVLFIGLVAERLVRTREAPVRAAVRPREQDG